MQIFRVVSDRRQRGLCIRCDECEDEATAEHVIARSEGGKVRIDNIARAC